MVAPLPDEAAAHSVLLPDQVEVILEISRSITHAVTVLYQQEGLAAVPIQILPNLGEGRIHPAVEINILIVISLPVIPIAVTFILGESGVVIRLGPGHGFFEIAAIGAFIAHGPDHDTEAVFLPQDHLLHPIQNGRLPGRIIRQLFIPAPEALLIRVLLPIKEEGAMRLQIRLVNDHETGFRVRFMPVHAAELDLLSVEIHNTVPNLNVPQHHMLGDALTGCFQHKRITIGIFRVPKHRIGNLQLQGAVLRNLLLGQAMALGVLQANAGLDSITLKILKRNRQLCPILYNSGLNPIVPDGLLRPLQKIHIPKNAAHAELILILQVGTVAPLQPRHRKLCETGGSAVISILIEGIMQRINALIIMELPAAVQKLQPIRLLPVGIPEKDGDVKLLKRSP